ncbi:MAG: hypothetical protein JNM18_05820 [Planctomycetaceae bacterium]|nr:hypothetical protein [Planctomycetaceae bacterium]
MHWSFSPVVGYWFVAGVALVLLALLWFGPAREKISPPRRRTLVYLRLAIIALTILALLRPAWIHTTITKQAATLMLLLDQSRSMQVTDAAAKQSRWQVLSQSVYNSLPRLLDLDRDLEVQVYTFDAAPQRVSWDEGKFHLPENATGAESAIGHSLEELMRLSAGKRLAGVILISDGAQRASLKHDAAPQVAARRLADLGFPLYTIPLGQARGAGQVRDVAVNELRVPASVFVKNEMPVQAVVRLDGFVNQELPVQLLVETEPGKMTPIEAKPIQATEDGQEFTVGLKHLPNTPGEVKVTLQVAPQPGETITANNSISTFVTINSEGLNALYLEGVSRVEQKFVRRAMDDSPDIRVDYLRLDAQRRELNPPDMQARFTPGKYDVYLIGDLDSAALTDPLWQQLADTVRGGAGLMMLGGLHSFGAGGYGTSSLADVLPIEIGRFERQSFGEPIRTDLHLQGSPQMRLTGLGKLQSLLQIDSAGTNESAWKALPALDGANKFAGLKPGAQTLLETERGEPLLVAKNYGGGRVLAFAGDSTWRWPLHGFVSQHKRFWRQTILWLAQKDIRSDGNVWVRLDRRRFAPGMRVEFTAGARNETGDTVRDAKYTVEVSTPDGRKLPARLNQMTNGDQQGLVLDAMEPGDYTIQVRAQVGGVELGTTQARFLVYEQDLELENPAADRGTLEAIAAMTGGKTVAPEQLGSLVDEIRSTIKQFEVETQVKDTLWDTWPFFMLFIALLTAEWYLRKKWGLV